MTFTFTLRDLSSQELARAQSLIDAPSLALVGARGVAQKVRDHFQDLETSRPNKQGWPRQHFWGGARRSVNTPKAAEGNKATVSISKEGVALLYAGSAGLAGGVVRPLLHKYLTIPAVPEAYGKRARERQDLIFARRVNPATGRMQACLVEAEQTRVVMGPKSKKTGRRRFKCKGTAGGTVIYWLARKVRIPADPSVLPTEIELEQALAEPVERTLRTLESRR